MKKKLSLLLGLAVLMSTLSGCGPVKLAEGGADELSAYLSGKNSEEFMMQDNVDIDITDVEINDDRTIHLMEGVTLKIYGTANPGKRPMTVRAESENGKKPVLDLSGLSAEGIEPQEAVLFEVRCDVELIPPAETELIVVDTSNAEWTSVRMIIPIAPGEDGEGTPEMPVATTEEEFLELIGDPNVSMIMLKDSITADLNGIALSHDVSVNCNGYSLILKGNVKVDGGHLDLEDKSETQSTTIDISGLTVSCDDVTEFEQGDVIFFRMSFRQIIGEPTVGEGMTYEIPDSGESASVKIIEIITPEQHEAKLQEEMTQYLSGEEFRGGVGISSEFLADGVLEVHLDNPTVSDAIGVSLDGNTKLILTGSVTFDGGYYGFELHDDSSGMATVDISGLEIHGTEALGHTKSPDIFKITGDGVDFIFNEGDPHIQVVENEQFWLRYVQ